MEPKLFEEHNNFELNSNQEEAARDERKLGAETGKKKLKETERHRSKLKEIGRGGRKLNDT